MVLTPQLIVVAAALRLSTAVSRVTDVGLVVDADAQQLALQNESKKKINIRLVFTLSHFTNKSK